MTYFQTNKFNYRTKSKYKNKSTTYNGRTYHSIKEAQHCEELDWRKKAGEIKEIIPQFKVDMKINGTHICNYYVDFKVIMADDSIQFHEVKGFITEVGRLKMLMFSALLNEIEPGAEYIVIR